MTQNVQDLINKIKKEGIEASQEEAKRIEAEVQQKVDQLIAEAKSQAEKIVDNAKAEQAKIEESTKASLQQAARDTVLSLKHEINNLMTKIIKQDIRDALGKDQMTALITEIAKEFVAQSKEAKSVEVGLNEDSRKLLEKDLLAKLQHDVKAGISIETADDISGGFTISFDEGKSCFDFSEDALVAYLGKYVNEYVKNLLKAEG